MRNQSSAYPVGNDVMRTNAWALGLAATSLAGWVALALGRGNFWRAEAEGHLAEGDATRRHGRVEAVVPARNEEKTIGRALRSLLDQSYGRDLAITVVDDGSSDATAAEARAAIAAGPTGPRVDLVAGRPLFAPWTGKVSQVKTC